MSIKFSIGKVDSKVAYSILNKKKVLYKTTNKCETVFNRRMLIFDVQHKPENLNTQGILNTDSEIDMELAGKFIKKTSRIRVNEKYEPVYSYQLKLVKYKYKMNEKGKKKLTPTGEEKEFSKVEANINVETPLVITDQLFDPKELLLKYIFHKTLQINHIDGLTFQFLSKYAQGLAEKGKFAKIIAINPETKKSSPLILKANSRPYPAGFLEGRFRLIDTTKPNTVENQEYILLLHLTDRSIKVPEGFATKPPIEQKADGFFILPSLQFTFQTTK